MRCEEINKRKNTFLVNNEKFPLPRLIHRAIFYDEGRISERWCLRCWQKFLATHTSYRLPPLSKKLSRPLPIYLLSLAFARSKDSSDTLRKLRQDRKANPGLSAREIANRLEGREVRAALDRNSRAEKNYLECLTDQTDDQ